MEKNNIKKQNLYVNEEEKTLNWEEIQSSFKKTFGTEIFNSWLQKISLVKEFNDYLILAVPTRFFRDWIVSRYLDKILEVVKNFKLSLTRIEFKIIEENKQNQEFIGINDLNKVTEIILKEIKETLNRGEGVELRNFGTFRINIQKASIRRNPKTGEKINVPKKRTIKWKMSKDLFKKLNNEKE